MEAKEKKEAEEFLFCYLAVPNFSYIYASIRIKRSELILSIAFAFAVEIIVVQKMGLICVRIACLRLFHLFLYVYNLSKNFTH